jgi:hypothetical protein
MTSSYELERKMYEFNLGQLNYRGTRQLVRLLLEELNLLDHNIKWLNDVMDDNYDYIQQLDESEDY